MWVLGVLCVGVYIGYRWFPARFHRANSILQVICTAVLIFSMGIVLGSRENFLRELAFLGVDSLLLAVLPMAGSALLVYGLTRRFFPMVSPWEPEQPEQSEQPDRLEQWKQPEPEESSESRKGEG